MTKTAIGLGSNLGDRLGYLQLAIRQLGLLGEVSAISSLYETAPLGGVPQGAYLNAAVVLETTTPPRELLSELLKIEASAGRMRRERWGPRTLDLDLLLYGSETINETDIQVPHPRLLERRFALEPLLEVWPDPPLVPIEPSVTLAALASQQLAVSSRGRSWARLRPVHQQH